MTNETTATTEPTVTGIDVTLDPQSLIGDGTTWGAEGYDEAASTARYAAILTGLLEAEYPDVTVTVEWAPTIIKIGVMTQPWWTEESLLVQEDTQEAVQMLCDAVFEGRHGNWAVEAAR